MKTCTECGHKNYEGTIFCERCYKPVQKESSRDTQLVNPFQGALGKSTFLLAQNVEALTLIVQTEHGTRLVPFPHGTHFVLGRSDSDSSAPDIDLTMFGAREYGVSRQHAAVDLTKDALTLTDLESRNGTYLNRKQLTPYDINILRSGDEIRLGRLVMRLLTE